MGKPRKRIIALILPGRRHRPDRRSLERVSEDRRQAALAKPSISSGMPNPRDDR